MGARTRHACGAHTLCAHSGQVLRAYTRGVDKLGIHSLRARTPALHKRHMGHSLGACNRSTLLPLRKMKAVRKASRNRGEPGHPPTRAVRPASNAQVCARHTLERAPRARPGTRARLAPQRQRERRRPAGFELCPPGHRDVNNPLTVAGPSRAGDSGSEGGHSPPPSAARAASLAARAGDNSHPSQRSAAAGAKAILPVGEAAPQPWHHPPRHRAAGRDDPRHPPALAALARGRPPVTHGWTRAWLEVATPAGRRRRRGARSGGLVPRGRGAGNAKRRRRRPRRRGDGPARRANKDGAGRLAERRDAEHRRPPSARQRCNPSTARPSLNHATGHSEHALRARCLAMGEPVKARISTKMHASATGASRCTATRSWGPNALWPDIDDLGVPHVCLAHAS